MSDGDVSKRVEPAAESGQSTSDMGAAATPPQAELPTSIHRGASETPPDLGTVPPGDVVVGNARYRKSHYSPPAKGSLYSVRDKARSERIIEVIGVSPDGTSVQVEVLEGGKPLNKPVQLAVESLARQAATGWCSSLLPIGQDDESRGTAPAAAKNVAMRLDIQNFARCCSDIVRAGIKFDTQLIKDVGDGPFRAGQYEDAFRKFEQFALGFASAVANSRRAIADGRRALTAEKGKLSGKEIEERKAAFIRSEQLIHTAEREFSTILEGLRTYLRAQQG